MISHHEKVYTSHRMREKETEADSDETEAETNRQAQTDHSCLRQSLNLYLEHETRRALHNNVFFFLIPYVTTAGNLFSKLQHAHVTVHRDLSFSASLAQPALSALPLSLSSLVLCMQCTLNTYLQYWFADRIIVQMMVTVSSSDSVYNHVCHESESRHPAKEVLSCTP